MVKVSPALSVALAVAAATVMVEVEAQPVVSEPVKVDVLVARVAVE
jgi:hypothetical protein